MKTLKISLILFTIIGMVSMFSSCKKEDTDPDADTNYAQEDALAEGIFNDVTTIADEAYDLGTNNLKSGNGDRAIIGPCATISLDTLGFPFTLTIDFGEENCLCNDGRYRRGKIMVNFTGPYRQPGTVITTGFDSFYVNEHQVDGTKVVTNMGLDEDDHPHFQIEVIAIIHKPNNWGTLSWNASTTRIWVEGFNTFFVWDDVYEITGEADGIRPNGNTWEREIINPLRVQLNCRWITSGTMELRPEGGLVAVLDFGEGNCDNIATVLINGNTYTIFLP